MEIVVYGSRVLLRNLNSRESDSKAVARLQLMTPSVVLCADRDS